MKDGEEQRKVDETREFNSKGSYMFFRIVCALRSTATVGVVYNGILQY
jgi:hypothetical protein